MHGLQMYLIFEPPSMILAYSEMIVFSKDDQN